MSWHYDDPFGWFDDSEQDPHVALPIFDEVAERIWGPRPETPCAEDNGTSAITDVTESGRHHRVEASE